MLGKTVTLGFWLSDRSLEAALVRTGRKSSKVLAETAVPGENLLSSEDRSTRLTQALRASLRTLPRTVRRADMPAVLAVQDGHVIEDVFTFAEFPNAKAEARALVAHRLSREINVLPDDLDVYWENVTSADGAETVRVRAIKRALRSDIEAAAAAAGLRLIRIDGWAGFASCAPQLTKQDSGSAIWSDGTEWSLLCWGGKDAAGFSQTGQIESPESTAQDIVRLSLAYARRNDVSPGPLAADVPTTLVSALSEATKRAGLEVLALRKGPRAVQVATWA